MYSHLGVSLGGGRETEEAGGNPQEHEENPCGPENFTQTVI